jgi:glycosyltransferase involved in cell wall biosynthesis
MILLTHATGNENVRQAARGFLDAGLLDEFWTCFATSPDSRWLPLVPGGFRGELRRRAFDRDLLAKIRTAPVREFVRLSGQRLKLQSLTKHETGRFSTDAVMHGLARRVSHRLKQRHFDAVYAYDDGALEPFLAGEETGTRRIFELPTPHWRASHQIFREEAELQPAWAMTIQGLQDSAAKLERKDREAGLAELIVVPSQFVADGLKLCPTVTAPVKVIPYGCPEPPTTPLGEPSGPIRGVFVGNLAAGKGLPYLLEAAALTKIVLTLVGRKPAVECAPLDQALERHRYLGSVPRSQVLAELAQNDIFLFPTLLEGLSLALMEAMSQGLVPITTANSGAESIIEDGVDGFIVPIRSASAIAEKIELLDRDRPRLMQMKAAARETARRHSWAAYRAALVAAVSANP